MIPVRRVVGYLINREAADIFLSYLILSSRREKVQDFCWALIIGTLALAPLFLLAPAFCDVVNFVLANIPTVITALSILAGFNATSVAVIASSGSELSRKLRKETVIRNEREYSLLEVIVSFFSWALLIQLFLLLGSAALLFWLKFFYAAVVNPLWQCIFWVLLGFGVIFIAYSIVLTIRNISILHYYLVVQGREKQDR